jgi:hypothetical protein
MFSSQSVSVCVRETELSFATPHCLQFFASKNTSCRNATPLFKYTFKIVSCWRSSSDIRHGFTRTTSYSFRQKIIGWHTYRYRNRKSEKKASIPIRRPPRMSNVQSGIYLGPSETARCLCTTYKFYVRSNWLLIYTVHFHLRIIAFINRTIIILSTMAKLTSLLPTISEADEYHTTGCCCVLVHPSKVSKCGAATRRKRRPLKQDQHRISRSHRQSLSTNSPSLIAMLTTFEHRRSEEDVVGNHQISTRVSMDKVKSDCAPRQPPRNLPPVYVH